VGAAVKILFANRYYRIPVAPLPEAVDRHRVSLHSDQGCQYTSIAFGSRCRQAGVRPSMGSVSDCFDNAICESFFARLECELLDRTRFHTHVEGRTAIFDFIEGWYNTHRRHSALDYDSPINYERKHESAFLGATPEIGLAGCPQSPDLGPP